MIKVLVVNDHQLLIDGIKALFANSDTIDVCCEALTGQQAIEKALTNEVEVVLLNINLPDKSGFEVCKAIKTKKKQVKIIALTRCQESDYIYKMIKMGVSGYLLKNTGKDQMIEAITTVMKGEQYFGKEVIDSLLGNYQPREPKTSDFIQKLTRREEEVLQLIVDEYTTKKIAEKLFIAATTVISHRKSLLRKLNATNVVGLVKAVYEFGLLNKC